MGKGVGSTVKFRWTNRSLAAADSIAIADGDRLESAAMSKASAAPRLRPTAAPGVAAAGLAALVERRGGGFAAFEREAATLLGTRHAAIVGSARAGMAAILTHAGCRPGDEVIVPALTAPCVPAFLRASGYRVRVAAICPRRHVVTGDSLAAAVGPQTRAVVPTHVEGVTAPMAEITAALPSRIVVLEDAAHAFGAQVDGRPVGARAAGAVHSFGKGKHINTVFGGLVVTDDAGVAAAARAARDALPSPSRLRLLTSVLIELGVAAATHPRLYPLFLHPLIRISDRFGVDLPTLLFEDKGSKGAATVARRPPEAWAGLALAQLGGFSAERARRRALADTLRSAFRARGIDHQHANDPGDHPLFVTLLHPRREELRRALLTEGQDTQPTWMRSITGDDGGRDATADKVEREGLYLPIHRGARADLLVASLERALRQVPQ
jgi:dTDP-4-amino-4,6-dideoxygalactose transaminase